jgi:hypothetical protein
MDRLRDVLGGGDDDENRLPEHEYNDPNNVGGGVMSSGGTAVDRGTTQMEPSSEDDFAGGQSDIQHQTGREPDETRIGDLFGGRAENTGMDDYDEADAGGIPPQARPQL